jgi:competence protein ComEA
MNMQSQRNRAILAAVVVSVVFVIVLSVTRADRSRDLVLQIEPVNSSDEVTVYVGGAVADPGLYSLPRGSRIQDAIDLAGALDTADTKGLALASVVRDEQSIHVDEIAIEEPSEVDPSLPTSESSQSAVDSGINLNSASIDELEVLPGIGPAIAERILDHRETNGPFASVDQLSAVSGISDRMVEELRPLVTIAD